MKLIINLKIKRMKNYLRFYLITVLAVILFAGNANSQFNGTGTSDDPYLITSVHDLTDLATYVNSGIDFTGKYFIQVSNIDISAESWIPIGTSPYPFNGTYDGKSYEIYGLTINNSERSYQGLFGYVTGTIQNVGLRNVSINGNNNVGGVAGYLRGTLQNCYVSSGSVNGNFYVGGICGFNNGGTINTCNSTGTVTALNFAGGLVGYNSNASTIFNCYSTGTVSAENDYAGGIVGYNKSSISNCYSTGAVNALDYAGGLVGLNTSSSTIVNCYSTGAVNTSNFAGGLVGFNAGTIAKCYSTGTVISSNYTGGLVGIQNGSETNSFWDLQTSGIQNGAWGIFGSTSGIQGESTRNMQTESTFNIAGWDFASPVWKMSFGLNNAYPYLAWQIDVAPSSCINPSDGGIISADQSGCSPFTPTEITSIALPSGSLGILEYKWQDSTAISSVFTDIADSVRASYKPGTLTQTTWFRRLARVNCMSDWTGAAVSNIISITVNQSAIVHCSGDQETCAGTEVIFSVKVTGKGPFSYNWVGPAVGSDTVLVVDIPSWANPDVYPFKCNVSNACGTVTCTSQLTVSPRTSIDVNLPTVTSSCNSEGDNNYNVTFTVHANGIESLSYQWYKDNTGNPIGTNQNNLKINGVTTKDAGVYFVVISNKCGSITSNLDTLKIDLPISNSYLSISPDSTNLCTGIAATMTAHSDGTNLNYQWFYKNNPVGNNSSVFTIASTSTDNNGSYFCIVTNSCGSVTSNSLTLKVYPPSNLSNIYSFNGDVLCQGDVLAIVVNGTPYLPYALSWYHNGEVIPGANSDPYLITSSKTSDAGQYYMVISTICESVSSDIITLSVNTPPIITCPEDVTKNSDQSASFSVSETGTGPFSYQWYENGNALSNCAVYSGVTTTALTISNITGLDGYKYNCIATGTCGSATSCIATLKVNSNPVITKQPQSITQCPCPYVLITSLPVSCNKAYFNVKATGTSLKYQWQENGLNIKDNTYFKGSNTTSLCITNFSIKNGKNYRVIVSNNLGILTSSSASLTVLSSPVITQNPKSVSVNDGSSTSFTIDSKGTGLSYQWQVNGQDIRDNSIYSGSTSSTLSISNVSGLNKKQYRCMVCNTCSCATSGIGNLVVMPLCGIPVNERISGITYTTAKLAWNTVSGVLVYQVAYWTSDNSAHPTYMTSANPNLILCYLKSNTDYCWKVRTICNSCVSCASGSNTNLYSWSDVNCFRTSSNLRRDLSASNNSDTEFGMNVYPNPSTGIVNILMPNLSSNSDLSIYTMSGQKVYSEYISCPDNNVIRQIDMSIYKQGIYIVMLKNEQTVKTAKLILQ